MGKYLSLYILALIFSATNGIAASYVSLSSNEVVLFRCVLAFALQSVLFLFLKKGRFTCMQHRRSLLFLVFAGVFQGFNWLFLFEAYATIGVSLGILLGYCGPVFVMMLSPVLFQERLTLPKIAGFCVVFFGVFLVNGDVLLEGSSTWGLFCGLIAAVFYAAMNICNKFASEIDGMENSVILFFSSAITVILVQLSRQGFTMPAPTSSDILPLLYLGLISTGIGNHFYFSSMKHLTAQTVAACGYLEPVCAVILSAVLLHEAMTPLQLTGAACILGGAMFCELCQRQKAPTPIQQVSNVPRP